LNPVGRRTAPPQTRCERHPLAGPALPPFGLHLRQVGAQIVERDGAADTDGNGSLSVEEAQAFGFVARNFEAIDAGRRGAVTFDDLRAYLAKVKAERR
jgi:hypothetical protein